MTAEFGDETLGGRLAVGDLTIDYDRRRVVRLGEEIRLTPKEFELLSVTRLGPGPATAEEDRSRSLPSTLPGHRAVGGLPFSDFLAH